MSTKFEQLLDLLVNEEMDKANDLFHEIVVEKSREIYETMIAEEAEDEDDESVDEAQDDEDDESVEEGFGEEESMYEIGGDESDALVGDVEDPEATDDAGLGGMGDDEFGGGEGGEGGSEPATKDDVLDLKDALAELQSEFQALLAGEQHEEEGEPDIHGGELDGLGGGEDDGMGDLGGEEDEDETFMREYRETVKKPANTENGAHTVSPISKATGRPTTGATAHNIAQSGKGTGEGYPGGKGGGLLGKVKGEFTGQHLNKVGGYKGDAFTKDSSGHGTEKKGAAEKSTNSRDLLPK